MTTVRTSSFTAAAMSLLASTEVTARWNDAHPGQTAVTTIEGPATWYPAEDYHQEYWQGEGQRNPYCLAVIPPKLAKLQKGFAEKLRG